MISSIIALVFDFDGTLMPDATNALLKARGLDTDAFWKTANQRVEAGWDQALAWLDLFLTEVRPGGKLDGLTETDLRAFGATLDSALYPGVANLFEVIRAELRTSFPLVTIEYYIISGGLRSVIEAVPTIHKYVQAVYGSELGTDGRGVLQGIKRAVTFTEKTRYLFEIHKGLPQSATSTNPYLVNQYVPDADRRIPFENMVYVGDSKTDIPCFSLVERYGGFAAGVADLTTTASPKRVFEDLVAPRRTTFGVHPPRYDDHLGQLLRLAVDSAAARITARRSST